MPQPGDQFRRQAGAQCFHAQQVQQIIPRKPLQHSGQHAFRVEMADSVAFPGHNFIELVGIYIIIPHDMLHEAANGFLIRRRNHASSVGRFTVFVYWKVRNMSTPWSFVIARFVFLVQ